MHDSVDYLNLEYLLVRVYEFIAGLELTSPDLPAIFTTSVTTIVVVGMSLSLIFLIILVYAQIRLLQVEHAGFHAKEEHAHEVHAAEVEHTGRDPRWDEVVGLAASSNESDRRRAILEADILLGDALNKAGYTGAGVGEQLKMANPIQLTTLDLAWRAHKVRNDIAHQPGYKLEDRDARATIDFYKRVLEELGAI